MNEKLKELIENIFDGTEDLSEFQKNLAETLIQQYADEQTAKVLRWFEIAKRASRIPRHYGYDQIVTRYHTRHEKFSN